MRGKIVGSRWNSAGVTGGIEVLMVDGDAVTKARHPPCLVRCRWVAGNGAAWRCRHNRAAKWSFIAMGQPDCLRALRERWPNDHTMDLTHPFQMELVGQSVRWSDKWS